MTMLLTNEIIVDGIKDERSTTEPMRADTG